VRFYRKIDPYHVINKRLIYIAPKYQNDPYQAAHNCRTVKEINKRLNTDPFPYKTPLIIEYLKKHLVNTSYKKTNGRILLAFSLLLICTAGLGQKKQTDSFNINKASFYLPQPLAPGHYYSSISVLYVVTPRDWTDDIIAAPMFWYQAKYTLPKGFNVQASLASLFISNRILLGPFWDYKISENNFVGFGWQVAWNYGILNQFGFATTLTGWEQQPSITFGHVFNHMAVNVRGNLFWTNALYFSEGKNTIPFTNGFINGYSFGATLEQKLYKNRALSLGLQMDYVRYHIIAWPAFPVNQKSYWVPEFTIGLNL
jgi:hypothetical protein